MMYTVQKILLLVVCCTCAVMHAQEYSFNGEVFKLNGPVYEVWTKSEVVTFDDGYGSTYRAYVSQENVFDTAGNLLTSFQKQDWSEDSLKNYYDVNGRLIKSYRNGKVTTYSYYDRPLDSMVTAWSPRVAGLPHGDFDVFSRKFDKDNNMSAKYVLSYHTSPDHDTIIEVDHFYSYRYTASGDLLKVEQYDSDSLITIVDYAYDSYNRMVLRKEWHYAGSRGWYAYDTEVFNYTGTDSKVKEVYSYKSLLFKREADAVYPRLPRPDNAIGYAPGKYYEGFSTYDEYVMSVKASNHFGNFKEYVEEEGEGYSEPAEFDPEIHNFGHDYKIEFTYDDSGRVIKKLLCRSVNGVMMEREITVFRYDDHGNIIHEMQAEKFDDVEWIPNKIYDATYEYDAYGNWIERTQTWEDEKKIVERRVIMYH